MGLIVALTGISFVIVALLTMLLSAGLLGAGRLSAGLVAAGGDRDGGFDAEFLAACARSDAPQDRCHCALVAWNATVDTDARGDLDTALADDGELPGTLGSVLARC